MRRAHLSQRNVNTYLRAINIGYTGKNGVMEVWLNAFLTWALYGGQCLASRPGCFKPGERSPATPSI